MCTPGSVVLEASHKGRVALVAELSAWILSQWFLSLLLSNQALAAELAVWTPNQWVLCQTTEDVCALTDSLSSCHRKCHAATVQPVLIMISIPSYYFDCNTMSSNKCRSITPGGVGRHVAVCLLTIILCLTHFDVSNYQAVCWGGHPPSG